MKKQPNSIKMYNRFLDWLTKIKSTRKSELLEDNERFVSVLEKFAVYDEF